MATLALAAALLTTCDAMSLAAPGSNVPQQEQRLLLAAERGQIAPRSASSIGGESYESLERLLGAEVSEDKKRLEDLYQAAEQAWEAPRAEQATRLPGRSWFGSREEQALDDASSELAVKLFSGALATWLERAGYVEVDIRERGLCDAIAREAGLRVDVDDRPLTEMRCWRRGVRVFDEPLGLADALEYLLSESVERSGRRVGNIARNAAIATKLSRGERFVDADLQPGRARRIVTKPIRVVSSIFMRTSRQLLTRWGANRAIDEEECDVAAFAVDGVGCAGSTSAALAVASTPQYGWVELPRRGVGAAVDSALSNATSLWGAARALRRPPPRRCLAYDRVVALHATDPSLAMKRGPRRLGLALYEDVPLRTLGTLWPTRRLRVRPLDAVRFDVVTGATFLLLVAAQRLGTVWGDVAASVAVFAWVSRLLFNTKARRNMYELETTRGLGDRVRAKGATVCDAAARDAVETETRAKALCLGALRRLSWGEYDAVGEIRLRNEVLTATAVDTNDPAKAGAAADAALSALPDLVRRGLASRGPEGWRAVPRPDADASLSEAWLAAFSANRPVVAPLRSKAPSTVNEVIAYPFVDPAAPAALSRPASQADMAKVAAAVARAQPPAPAPPAPPPAPSPPAASRPRAPNDGLPY